MKYENRLNADGEFVDKLHRILQATNMPILQQCIGRIQSLIGLVKTLSEREHLHARKLQFIRECVLDNELSAKDVSIIVERETKYLDELPF